MGLCTVLMDTKPGWSDTYTRLLSKYGGSFLALGLGSTDTAVCIFLFVQKWVEQNPLFSAHKIFLLLRSLVSILPEEFRLQHTERNVRQALENLVERGFITRCDGADVVTSSGRPPAALYEINNMSDVRNKIKQKLRNYEDTLLNAIGPLEGYEEGTGLRSNNGEK